MPESILIDITTVLLLGIGAQWLAWRFRLPSILLLLLSGFLVGPVLGILDPLALQDDWLYAFVSVSIGIILFEGGLNLRLSELREVGTAVRNLISIGVLITWAMGAAAAYYIAQFNLSLSVLLGAILVVTGPTVIIPLLRHIRPKGRVGTIAKWEGITIDPVGAILAVLVLETILLLHDSSSASATLSTATAHVAKGLFLAIFVSVGVCVTAAGLLVLLFRRRLVPDFLRNPITLMVVVTAFVIANALQSEAGLLTTTLMGIAIANQSYVSVHRIVEFKENLQVLLIGSLFVLLSARLEMSALQFVDMRTLVFLGVLVLIVRPVAVFISSLGTKLSWEEQTFLAWMAPRGIVAAAVASLFAFELRDVYPQTVDGIVPVVFSVILGTVAIYGLTASPLARWLDLADPDPQGVLFVGAEKWVRKIARVVQDLGFTVRMIDTNPGHVREAHREGIPIDRINALSESALDELDLSGIGRLLVIIPNDEVSSLTALHFSEVFETKDIFQLAARTPPKADRAEMPKHLRGHLLFGEEATYESLEHRFDQGHEVKIFELSDDFTYKDLQDYFEDAIIPMFVLRNGELFVCSEEDQFTPRPDDEVVALVDPEAAGGRPMRPREPGFDINEFVTEAKRG